MHVSNKYDSFKRLIYDSFLQATNILFEVYSKFSKFIQNGLNIDFDISPHRMVERVSTSRDCIHLYTHALNLK